MGFNYVDFFLGYQTTASKFSFWHLSSQPFTDIDQIRLVRSLCLLAKYGFTFLCSTLHLIYSNLFPAWALDTPFAIWIIPITNLGCP